MEKFLWLIPGFPLFGFLILTFAGRKISRAMRGVVGAGSISLAALVVFVLGWSFLSAPPAAGYYVQTLWTWFEIGNFKPTITLHLDALSLLFVFVITFIGALIHIYSAGFMAEERDVSRFFACMNLFVFCMLLLVLADNLLLLYLGWEGVGLCSYLLIGFWYQKPENGQAAAKAFIITRIGDTAMAIALFVIMYQFGTLDISTVLQQAPEAWTPSATMATVCAMLLLAGALGKSAQLPLQTWLPDAMAGPSPVSALIHAATMVTAGVYLIARMHVIFQLSPITQMTIAIIGAATLIIAGCSAMAQYDIKRVLAYSTISQIGYMFLSLGVGAWTPAIFHFMIHAFFKALLFLAAGAIIEALHHEHNMFRMGGLRTKMPVIFWTFLIGAASLSALPLVTAGFYSKDQILWYSWASAGGSPWLWLMAIMGAFITAAYTSRMMILTFWTEQKTPLSMQPEKLMTIPLLVLAVFALLAGFIELPHNFGHVQLFSSLLARVLPDTILRDGMSNEFIFQLLAVIATLAGIYAAYVLYYKKPALITRLKKSPSAVQLYGFLLAGWHFDRLYNFLLVRPLMYLSNLNRNDIVDKFYQGIVQLTSLSYRGLSATQSGSLRWYVMGLVIGAIFILTIQIML